MAGVNNSQNEDVGCSICHQPDSGEMVACDDCNAFFHFTCVGVDATIADRDWSCASCVAAKASTFRPTANLARSPLRQQMPPLNSQSTSTQQDDGQNPDDNHPTEEVPLNAERLLQLIAEQQESQQQLLDDFAAFRNERREEEARLETRATAAEQEVTQLRAELDLLAQQRSQEARNQVPSDAFPVGQSGSSSGHDPLAFQSPIIPGQQATLDRLRDISARQKALNARLPTLRLAIPPSPPLFDAEAISARIIEQLSASIPSLVRDMTQSSNVEPLIDLRTPSGHAQSTQSLPMSAPIVSSFETLAATMQRKYLRDLPDFNGDEKAWAYFEAVYESTTVEGRYSEADNVARLRKALKPPALDLVKDMVMFTNNAAAIMSELRDAYGRPDKLIVRLLDELLLLPQLRSPTDVKLREFAIAVKCYVANCKAMKRPRELANEYAMNKLAVKLHFSHYKEWQKHRELVAEADLETFAQFLMRKVKEIPPALFSTGESSRPQQPPDPKKARVMSHQQGNTSRNSSCFMCQRNHLLFKCPDFIAMRHRERSKFVWDNKICSACLLSAEHQWADCPTKRTCNLEGCTKSHHRFLHNAAAKKNSWGGQSGSSRADDRPNVSNNQSAPAQTSKSSTVLQPNASAYVPDTRSSNAADGRGRQMSHVGRDPVLFKIIKVRLHGMNENIFDTFAYLDEGSSITLLDLKVYNMLELAGTPERIHLQWTKGITRIEDSVCTQVAISGCNQRKPFKLTNVFTVKNLDLPEQTIISADLKARYSHLRGLPLPDYTNAQPTILIGLRHAQFLLSSKHHVGAENEPIASKTRLGWVVYGAAAPSLSFLAHVSDRKSSVHQSMFEATKADEELHSLVKGFFTTQNFGVMPPKRDLISEENKRALEIMSRSLCKVSGRYEIGLLWKSDNVQLPDSYGMAMSRLVGLERSLKKKPEMLEWKNQHVADLIAKGYARVATKDDLGREWPRVWYCPTFVVTNENKRPPKPRVVADVAAKVRGQSLNSNLLKGPDNLVSLIGALNKFRENAIAVNADVKEMFPQIAISPEDQQCQRFLWRNGDESRQPTVYIMQRMMFGPTCSPSCAQYVKNTHAEQYRNECPEAVEAITEKTYVDDYFSSHATVEKAVAVSTDAIKICDDMGFELTEFQSNCAELLQQLPPERIKPSPASVDISDKETEGFTTKVLGMFWRPEADVFTFQLTRDALLEKLLCPDYTPTKREILKMIMRVFDPLGLIAHFIIRGKIVMQEIWREGTGWDEPIPSSLVPMWKAFIYELVNIERLEIPRHYAPVVPGDTEVELIIFVDASIEAFCATAYFRFIDGDSIEVAHVMAKCKVAPVKCLTMPHLETQGCVLGTRLAIMIKRMHTFHIARTRYLCDAKVALAWITSKTFKFKPFVAARVGEILDSTTRQEWFHVRSKDNVADDGTKWNNPDMSDSKSRWFKGPSFLQEPFSQWPVTPACQVEHEPETLELARVMAHQQLSSCSISLSAIDEIAPRFKANWLSLLRVIAYLSRASAKLRPKPGVQFITPFELQQSELKVFQKIQQEAFPEEMRALMNGRTIANASKLKNLCPFLIDGVIRMSGRSQKAMTSYAAKNPVILPNKHELVDLLISHYHEKNLHMGEEMTIADTREGVWIIDVRSAVQRVARRCQWCKILRALPRIPRMGPLPSARMEFGMKPFTHTGLDAFGPYYVKFGRGTIKRWGLIFTCLTYRAVHLEVLNDMSTDQCIMSIRRFLTRRGWCAHFYSDNGTNFVGAKNKINADLKQLAAALGEALSNQFRISWHFQPAYSPWFGGAWERLIQSIKKCIDHVMNGETPREDVFRNAMVEAEFWMNRRPLTHMPIDHEDAKPLTPNTALFGDNQDDTARLIGIFADNDSCSRSGYKRSQHLVNKFLGRWVRDYLPALNRRTKWNEDSLHSINVGDIVIVTEPTLLKDACQKGRIVKVHPGSDGKVRAADVQLGDEKRTILKSRSAGRIAVLDVKDSSSQALQPSVLTAGRMSSCDDPSIQQ